MYRITALLFCSLLFSCTPNNSKVEDGGTAAVNTQRDAEAPPTDAKSEVLSPNEELTTKSISAQRRAGEFDFTAQFPVLNSVLQNRPDLHQDVIIYASKIITGKDLTEAYQAGALADKRKRLMPLMSALIESWDQQTEDLDKLSAMDKELNTIGMRAATSEGMFVTLVPSAFPASVMNVCPDDMKAHLDFIAAVGATAGGEYPFGNMAPYGEALWAGESLMTNHPGGKYTPMHKAQIMEIASIFLGMYLRKDGGYDVPAVGYPGDNRDEFGLSETESHAAYLDAHPDSKFTPAISSMLDAFSVSKVNPEELYVVYDRYFDSKEEAEAFQFEQLWKGNDLLHCIPVLLGNGKTNYLVSYRFYDDSEAATAFFTQKETADPEVKMMFVSWTKDGFVQSGI